MNWIRDNGFPVVIISGRRSSDTNRSVGGAPNSRHLTGRAVDLQVVGYTRDQIPDFWRFVGEVAEGYLGLRWGGRFNPPDVNHFDFG